jgi:hypothetical protein
VAPAHRLVQSIHVDVVFLCDAMGLLDRGDSFGEKNPCPPDHDIPRAGRVTWQNQRTQRLLMNPDQVQRFQPDRHRPASQSLRCLQARLRPLP